MTCCAYFDNNDRCLETYLEHIYCMNLIWNQISKYYLRGLQRILGDNKFKDSDVDRLMRIAFLAHDAGKLLQTYVKKKGNFQYRHEIVGAYVTRELIRKASYDDNVSKIMATAVLLHHEGIILSAYAGEYNEKIIPLSTIKKVIEDSDFGYICNLRDDPYYQILNKSYTEEIDWMNNLLSRLNKDQVYETVTDIISYATIGGLVIRNKVASVLHLLSVVDSVAATINRGGGSKDAGTQLSKLALNNKAELIKEVKCKWSV